MADELITPLPLTVRSCPACGSEIAPRLLSCPSCHWLVHTDRLKGLAEAAAARGTRWRVIGRFGWLERCADITTAREPAVRGHHRQDCRAWPSGGNRIVTTEGNLVVRCANRSGRFLRLSLVWQVRSRESWPRWRSLPGSLNSWRRSC